MKRRVKMVLKIIFILLLLLPVGGYFYLFVLPVKDLGTFSHQGYSPQNVFLTSDLKINNTITLSNGRVLGFAEYGDASGIPVFYFHGGQESRLSSAFMHKTAIELGIRIIAPDRPGIGLSTFQENRRFLDWPDDIVALADFLKIDRFSVFGLSGGAPHVLACAHKIPERLVHVSIVCGAAPYEKGSLKGMWPPVKFFHWLATKKNDAGLRKIIWNDYKGLVKNPKERIKQFQNYLPEPDKKIMTDMPEHGWAFINGSVESYRKGIDGVVQEWKLYVEDWGFPIEKINPPIHLWFGTEDKMAPTYRAHYYEKTLPHATLKLIENEGHFSLIRNHLNEILNTLKPEQE